MVAIILVLGATYRLVDSYHGRALRAIRDHEITAQVMGINTPAYKIVIFTLAAGPGRPGRVLSTPTTSPLSILRPSASIPPSSSWPWWCWGGWVHWGLGAGSGDPDDPPELLRQTHGYQDLIYGALLVGLLILRPEGILGRGKLSLKFLKREG